MRYLNKIVFINSASVKYADISIDGNVHFIGTQGVGKSTALRAILFFYNADKLKLGISKEKKGFDEYYFPYSNSFIVYEVVRETGVFCVMAFKSQSKTCFRFFDAAYDKHFFIDPEGRAFETWDKTIKAFAGKVNYTRKIDRYEEYRDVLYGNNKIISPEFRKYALIESRQYQNIPRTIQNVFLNSKLDAEFIKQTIIMSLNEEDITVDLSNYTHHLKDFETQLNDIKKWTEKTRNGEIIVRKQAEAVSSVYAALRYAEREKNEIAGQLVWSVAKITEEQPVLAERLEKEQQTKLGIENKSTDIEKKFQAKREKNTAEISVFDDRLKTAKRKLQEYENIQIEGNIYTIFTLIERVLKKGDVEAEKENLLNEKKLLTLQFQDITSRYESIIKELKNQFNTYEQSKEREQLDVVDKFQQFKDKISGQYDKIIDETFKQNEAELQVAKSVLEGKIAEVNNLKIKKAEIKYKRYFEAEIENSKKQIAAAEDTIRYAGADILQDGKEIKTLQREWEIEEGRLKEISKTAHEKLIEKIKKLTNEIAEVEGKIENSKQSFYGWLNEHYVGWEQTIGKVADVDTILFNDGLSPEKVNTDDSSFYGIRIDLSAADKKVKTIEDYGNDKQQLQKEMNVLQQKSLTIEEKLQEDLEKLKRRFLLKIKDVKEKVSLNEYVIDQSKNKLDKAKVELQAYSTKADVERKRQKEENEKAIEQASEKELKARETLKATEDGITKQVEQRKREKAKKIAGEEQLVQELTKKLKEAVSIKRTDTEGRTNEIKLQQTNELSDKGADTRRLTAIDNLLLQLDSKLVFIDNNRDKVAEYNKDKRELFDKQEEFKQRKNLLEQQAETELQKHLQQKNKLNAELKELQTEIESITGELLKIAEDVDAFEKFKISDTYQSVDAIYKEWKAENKTEKRSKTLIDDLNRMYYAGIKRLDELKENINKFLGNFSPNNIFNFKINLIDKAEYLQFADELKDFVDEDKIAEYEKRVNERFANIIKQIGKETTELISKESEIQKVITDINRDFVTRNFAGVIKSIELRIVSSENKVVQHLIAIKNFNDENMYDLGQANLFSSPDQEAKNKRAVDLLKQMLKDISDMKEKIITLSDSFELQFRIIENDNDTSWVEKLSNVGSDGTDVLVKAMINIMLLNVFKEGASRRFKDFRVHCMMDEIGKLHPNNVRGILKFANDRNILLINSSPTSLDSLAYRYTYLLAKDAKNVTTVKRLIRKGAEV